jgi:aquaporin Z
MTMADARAIHWTEYALETAGLACFMVSAVAFTALFEHPSSPAHAALPDPVLRRAAIGAAMGLTAAALIYSPWGQRSGAHLNPSVTLAFYRLGRIGRRDAIGYVLAHFAGAAAGILAAVSVLRGAVAHPAVNYVATVPGAAGALPAFAGELAISFVLMTAVLAVSNTPRLARYTGAVAATLVAIYITVEAPLSGMSMNPARSLAPAVAAGALHPLWIYFSAPPLGMLLAAELFARRYGPHAAHCAKLHHPVRGACHFGCDARPAAATTCP